METKFSVGDRVISPHFGEGIITGIDESEDSVYPIHVKWTKLVNPSNRSDDVFTLEGRYTVTPLPDPEFDQSLILKPLKKEEWDDKKMSTEDEKFHVGDRVYAPHFGEGIITGIDTSKFSIYPIHVEWTEKKQPDQRHGDIFTPEGFYTVSFHDPDMDISLVKGEGFKLMDRVFYPYYGKGTVVADYRSNVLYPIKVKWDDSPLKDKPYSNFTRDGRVSVPIMKDEENLKLMRLENVPKEETGGSKMGQIAGVINHAILQKEREKMHDEGRKFKVGDRVFSFYYGYGVVEKISDKELDPCPVVVRWEQDKNNAAEPNTCDYYTMDGEFYGDDSEPERDIFLMNDKKDESTVERMEDGLQKKVEDAINPSHYRVEGLPEAIDIINHLMHREQYEGFLWGNILKYAYRFGRKGDKAETAGKIAWYATQLKELEEEKRK